MNLRLLRKRIADFVRGSEPVVPPAPPSAAELYQIRKARIFGVLRGATIGDSLAILTDIVADMLAQDVTSYDKVQEGSSAIQELAMTMIPGDFMYLLAGGLNAYVHTKIPTTLKDVQAPKS